MGEMTRHRPRQGSPPAHVPKKWDGCAIAILIFPGLILPALGICFFSPQKC